MIYLEYFGFVGYYFDFYIGASFHIPTANSSFHTLCVLA